MKEAMGFIFKALEIVRGFMKEKRYWPNVGRFWNLHVKFARKNLFLWIKGEKCL